MNKTKAAPAEHRTATTEASASAGPPAFKPPFAPRLGLFYALLGLLGLWIAVLVVMYFTTVYPTRSQQPTELPASPGDGKTVPRD